MSPECLHPPLGAAARPNCQVLGLRRRITLLLARLRRALPSALAHKLGGNSAVAVERRSRDGCEGGGGRPSRARQGRRGGAALRERPLPARLALAAARVPTLLPGLRAGAAARARRVGANWVPAFPSPTRPSPQRSRSLEPDSPPGKLSRAPAWLNLAPTQARPSPYPAGRPAASFITGLWPWLCPSCGPTLSALNPGLSGPSKTHWHAFPAFLLPSSQPSALCWPSPSPGSSLRSGSLQRSLWAGRTHRRALFPSALREMWGGGALGSVAAGTRSGCYGQAGVGWGEDLSERQSRLERDIPAPSMSAHLSCEFFVHGHLQVEFWR